jgi:hypothetical protein
MSPALIVAAARNAALGALAVASKEVMCDSTFQNLTADEQAAILNALHAEIARVAGGVA